MAETDLKVNIAGVEFKNPVIAASGTYGFGSEYSHLYPPSLLGGLCLKGVTLHPRKGNSGQRLHETPAGLMNSIGLQNPGIDSLITDILPRLKSSGTVIIANVGGDSEDEYIKTVLKLNDTAVDMIELNISCPNVRCGGMAFGLEANTAYQVVNSVRQVCRKPLIVKLSPNAGSIVSIAEACTRAGADAISLVNTFRALAIDVERRRPVFDNIFAGLSGPAIKPLALAMVWDVCHTVDIPVIGMGGISSAGDALEFLMAGASAVQVGTASFTNPLTPLEITAGLKEYMQKKSIPDIPSLPI